MLRHRAEAAHLGHAAAPREPQSRLSTPAEPGKRGLASFLSM